MGGAYGASASRETHSIETPNLTFDNSPTLKSQRLHLHLHAFGDGDAT